MCSALSPIEGSLGITADTVSRLLCLLINSCDVVAVCVSIEGELREQSGRGGGIRGCASGPLRFLRHGGRRSGRPHHQQEENVQKRLLHHLRRQGVGGKGKHREYHCCR